MKMFEFFKLNFYLFSGKIVLEIKFLHKNVRQFDNFEVFLSVFWDVNKSIKTCLKNILLLPTLFNRNFRITVEHELTFKNIPSQLMLEIIVVIITISNTSGTLYKFLTLFRMGFFRAAHRWGGEGGWGQKSLPSLKPVTHILKLWKLGTVIPSKKYMNHVADLLSSADVSIFSPEISKFCYIKKWIYRLHFYT